MFKTRFLNSVRIIVWIFALYPAWAPAGTVQPDPSFSLDGVVTLNAGYSDSFRRVSVLPDGSILAGGSLQDDATTDPMLAKYDSSGNLMTVTTHDFGTSTLMKDMKVLSNGSILAVAVQYNATKDFLLTRFTSQNSWDSSFGTNGKEVFDFGGDDFAYAVDIQSTGKIIVAGTASVSVSSIGLVRYGANGGIDNTFGVNGQVSSNFTGSVEGGNAIRVLSDNSILVAGYVLNAGGNFDFFLAKYTANGQPDTSFGQGGSVSVDFSGNFDFAHSIALQGNKIILAGYTQDSSGNKDLALARLDMDGNPDPNFGTGGKVRTDFSSFLFNSQEQIESIFIQPDQKIVVVGGRQITVNFDLLLGRYTVNGDPDTTFGGSGFIAFKNNGVSCWGYGVTVQPDGKILSAGFQDFDTDALLVRFSVTGSNGLPASCSGAAFCDLFDNPLAGPVWTVGKPAWSELSGQFVGTPTGKKATVLAPSNWVSTNLYTVQAGMQSSGGVANAVSLYAWYLDKKNMIELQMKEESDKWIIKHKSNGVVTAKAKGIRATLPNQTYNVKMIYDGANVKVYVDDPITPLIIMPVVATVPQGTVGFSVKNTTGKFESIRVDD